MLLPLLVLVTVSHMTVAQIDPAEVDRKVYWFSKSHSPIFASSSDDGLTAYLCLGKARNETGSNLCVWLGSLDTDKFTSFRYDDGNFKFYMESGTVTLNFGQTLLTISKATGSRKIRLTLEAGTMLKAGDLTSDTSTTLSNSCYDGEYGLLANAKGCAADGRTIVCSKDGAIVFDDCKLCKSGECLIKKTCTLAGNQIFNKGGSGSIPDRCAYTLINSKSGYTVTALLRDRRRTDVPLLDAVEVKNNDHTLLFKRGQVMMAGVEVNLTSLSLSGVSVDETSSGFSFITDDLRMVFSGDAVTIGVSATGASQYTSGFCGGESLPDTIDSRLSDDRCYDVIVEDQDPTINCTESKEHCSLLESSFPSCFSRVEGDEFVKACGHFLCKYPSVDTARCMFHEALAMTCDMMEVPETNWRKEAQCEATAGKCMDTVCARHEFCGLRGDEEKCFCRSGFASPYRTNKTFGDPTVCSGSSASLDLYTCLLDEINIHSDHLQLIDPKCTGLVEPEKGRLTFGFNSTNMCGTNVTVEKDLIMHKNKVILSNHSSSLITRQDQFELDFSCFYGVPQIQTVGLKIRDSSVVKTIVTASWSYNLSMKAYEDKDRTKALGPGANLLLDTTVWVEIHSEGLDKNLVRLVTDSCWATSEAAANATLKYDLVKMGCASAADESVTVHENGMGTSNYFSFNTFKFSGVSSSDLYLHCEVSLCVDKECAPTCKKSRRRRSLRRDRTLISMF